MTINAGDIKLVASQLMEDVDQGGGAPSATVINDGTSNGVFPDISELDRAGGRVNMRKVFATVQTANADGYFGANLIVAEPPQDPLVSVTLFNTEDTFDRRADAQNRVESYLTRGPLHAALLFGDHIQGQSVISVLQRTSEPLPSVGDTFYLIAYENASNEVSQYVRVTSVSSQLRTFTDDQGDFQRTQVTMEISDSLRSDFPGFQAQRQDANINYTNKTKFCTSVVADAARYYGVSPLEATAALGDFSITAESIFSQLVPSTRVEVPIADARLNQQVDGYIAAGAEFTRSLTLAFTTTQAMFIGGSILPGTLSVVRNGITLTDKGGVLLNGGVPVGTVDYENGVLTLTTNVFGTSGGAHSITYIPASNPTVVSESIGIKVTQQSQRASYVVTLAPIPSKRTLTVSYRTLGRWYILTEDGSGAIRGSDSAYGAGTVNYTTGTVSVTLGALPDVGSQVIFSYGSSAASRPLLTVPNQIPALSAPRFAKTVTLAAPIKPGTLTLTWNDGAAKAATDSAGLLTGDAIGRVDYGAGRIEFSPNSLPAKNTVVAISLTEATPADISVMTLNDGGSTWTFNLSANIKPRSVTMSAIAQYAMREFPGRDTIKTDPLQVFDDGAGNLVVGNISSNLVVGTVNYSTGACAINKTVAGFKSDQQTWINTTPLGAGGGDTSSYIKPNGYEQRVVSINFLSATPPTIVQSPGFAWWADANQAPVVRARFATTDGSTTNYNFSLDELFYPAPLKLFTLGAKAYYVRSGVVSVDTDPNTGVGTVVGEIATRLVMSLGNVSGTVLSDWTLGQPANPSNVSGTTTPALSGASTPLLVESATFRTAVSPLLNGGFSVTGTRMDGTLFNVTADTNGRFATGGEPADADSYGSFGVWGSVDYDSGVVTLRFGSKPGTNVLNATGTIDVSALGIPGLTRILAAGVQSDTLRYNAVGYSYLPLDADILGLDPVRLPPDGRVPIFRPGSFAVVGHTGTVTATVSNGQTINCARVRLSRVRVIGNNGQVIDTGYTANLDTGLVTFTDVSGYSQPVTVEHRIEDMMLVSDAQINGQITFTRPLTHAYPLGSYVSSALVWGDRKALALNVFDQATWGNVWSDAVSGSPASGTYNDVLTPIEVTNRGALTERWALVFTNSTTYNIIGEHVGVIGQGNTGTDCSPINPSASVPYFTIRAAGWGVGWATGNVLRFNTEGAAAPAWVARTVLQGPETVPNDSFTLLIRGDVDRP